MSRVPRVGKLINGGSFVSGYGFSNIDQASEWLVKMCASSGSSVGVKNPEYVKHELEKAVYVLTAEDYKESGPRYEKILAFMILTPDETKKSDLPRDVSGRGIHLALVCSRAAGSGGYLLEQLNEIAKKDEYQFISLSAVKGVQDVYERRGFKYLMLNDEGLPDMIKKIGGRRKSRKNGFRRRKTMRHRR